MRGITHEPGLYIKGIPDPTWHQFLGLFITKEADVNGRDLAEVLLDPSASDLHNAVGGSALVVNLVDVVFRVGEHCKRLGHFELDPW